MKRAFLYGSFIAVLAMSAAAQTKKPAVFPTSGSYHGIVMTSKESGDYGGVDVYLTQTDTKTYALVTRAEGVSMPPVLVEATMSGKDNRTISFTVPIDNSETLKFRGKITAAGLKFDKGTEAEGLYAAGDLLKRTCGGTYSDISVGKQSGDYGGMEIYLMESDGAWYALVTTAESTIGKPQLIDAKVTGKNYDQVELTIPIDPSGGRHMKGSISAKTNTLTLSDNDGSKTVLKSKCYK